jgi:hypothetical protein
VDALQREAGAVGAGDHHVPPQPLPTPGNLPKAPRERGAAWAFTAVLALRPSVSDSGHLLLTPSLNRARDCVLAA